MRRLSESWRNLPEQQKKQYLLGISKVRQAIEEGRLSGRAKEIALYQVEPPREESVWDLFERFQVRPPLVEEHTEEQREECRRFMQEYLDVADALALPDPHMYSLIAFFLSLHDADGEYSEEERQRRYDAWCLKYGHAFPRLPGVQKRLKELRDEEEKEE